MRGVNVLIPPGPTLDEYGDGPESGATGEDKILDNLDPIEHGFALEADINDRDHPGSLANRRLFEACREHVGDGEHEPYVVLEDVHIRFD